MHVTGFQSVKGRFEQVYGKIPNTVKNFFTLFISCVNGCNTKGKRLMAGIAEANFF